MTKYYWVVSFSDGYQHRINSARGWKDANTRATRATGRVDSIEVRRHDITNSHIKVWSF
jgi:hypothetical protein